MKHSRYGQIKTTVSITEEEYIQYELLSDVRHEYINGQLMEMRGEAIINILIANNLVFIFKTLLRGSGYRILTHKAKLKVPEHSTYFYPDLFLTNEEVDPKKYVCYTAILIVEILSPCTRPYDMVDKNIQYQKIPEL